jgi:hypothetical protein
VGTGPTRSRANSFTAATLRNFFNFFFLAIADILPQLARQPQNCNNQVMEERDFFDERPDKKTATLNCPHCQQPGEYEINWLVRTKKRQLPGRADERDRARFAKARSYMIRRDDMMACKNMRCRKRFEISGVQSVVFTE